ncbi:unnamed protein product [Leptidea sinapis]|uniref:Amino acid transporter transmembrane domain-containing protein n=1 Tax=Leptidea sinapis TaxID=189913 RepID=A0A5E4PMV4_9NEOP|nr:unnamed protein product [Leptidea sinapis]
MGDVRRSSLQGGKRVFRSEPGSERSVRYDEGNDYEPADHRQLPNPTTNLETLFHLLRVGIGTGILAMPQAFAKAGLITGTVCTILVGMLVTHCLRILVMTLYNTCKLKRVPLLTYPEAVKVSIGRGPSWMHWVSNPGAIAVDVFVIVYQLGVCCVYIVFIGDNLKKLCDAYVNYTVEIYMLMILLPLIMLNMIPNLKLLAPLSGVANIMAALSIIFIAYFLLSGKKSNQPLDYWGTLPNFPLFFGTIVFALTSVGVTRHFRGNWLKLSRTFRTSNPRRHFLANRVVVARNKLLQTSPYFKNRLDKDLLINASAVIYMHQHGVLLASAAVILYTISIFISYALNCYVPVDIIWRNYLGPALERRSVTKLRLCEYLLRIILCLFTSTSITLAMIPMNIEDNMETLVHLLKCSLGTGILAMPQAFARAGLVTGIIATVLVGILVTHCLKILIYMVIILGPLVGFNLIPSLKVLAPFSALANLMTFVGLGIIVYFLLTGKKSEEPLDLWGSPATFPLFFGTILFALTAVGVVIAIENNMKTPKAFVKPFGVLNVGMTIIVVLYVAVGSIGYLYCVSDCSDSITLDLPQGPFASTVMGMFAVAIFISYGLQCYVPVEVLWEGYLLPRLGQYSPEKQKYWQYVLLAVSIPRLGLFISLFGALCLSALGICFPALMEACLTFQETRGQSRGHIYVKDAFLFIIGLVGLVAGTYTALISIVRSFQPSSP